MEQPEPTEPTRTARTSPTSPGTLVSPTSPATPGSAAPPVTPGSAAPPATPGSAAPPATPGSAAPPNTPGSAAFAITSAAQVPLTFPSSSSPYAERVSRIITSQKQRAGIWFPHLDLMEKTPESTTAAMLKQPFLPESKRKLEDRLPSRYQLRQQQASKSNFPFSLHDNRHGLEFCGHGLDDGLGRKKLDQVQTHFDSTNFNRWASDYVPTPDDNLSTYQASYVPKPKAKGFFFRLYPKHHSHDRWGAHFI
ncbi:testis-expressed protein 36 [Dromiciops gliroides]|uniref:testis-expressed protein 36 n=1 Tax=Dromiciops gliroides TaxID=33562 RepID=UPI001CC65B51|nr:testis-expressed protein 36 [Dromiciops gliroides]